MNQPIIQNFKIYSRQKWNRVNDVILEEGTAYNVEVEGSWYDFFVKTDARGYTSDRLKIFRLFPSIRRCAERCRRVPDADWFSLIGTIEKDMKTFIDIGGQLKKNGQGNRTRITPVATGPFYCFANDLPFMYWNNWGAIHISIAPLS